MIAFGHLQGIGAADVAGQAHIHAPALHDVIDESRGGRLAVAARDADGLAAGILTGKFQLCQNGCALLYEALHDGRRVRNAGALDHGVGRENLFLGVVPFFPTELVLVQCPLILFLNAAKVAHEDIPSLLLCQDGCAHAAFCSAQNC